MASDPPISDEDLKKAVVEMAAALAQCNAKYAVIGGMATAYRSQPRFTKAVDILLAIPQVALLGLLHELQRRGFEFDLPKVIQEWTQEHMTVLSFRGIRIDWLKPVIPAYLHILDRTTEESWFEQPIRVASAEGLILLKLLAFRTQDLVDIENLVAAQGPTLDLEWIKTEWQPVAGFEDPRMQRLLELTAG
jgi:hypothetical protein